MKEMNHSTMTTHTHSTYDLESMRQELQELKSLIANERIVNERMMRRAINTDLSQERKYIRQSCIFAVLGIGISSLILPWLGTPIWFTVLTVAFMLTAIGASVYSLRKHMAINMTEDNLVEAAQKIITYKQYCNNWLKFSLPFLAVWLTIFFYTLGRQASSEELRGLLCGGVLGLVIGLGLGFSSLYKSRKRLNDILTQIRELQGEE